jgi:hypothetical protein
MYTVQLMEIHLLVLQDMLVSQQFLVFQSATELVVLLQTLQLQVCSVTKPKIR